MKLKQTWRWFGPDDPVKLDAVSQAGAAGIVTALHHVPHGAVWTMGEIKKRKNEVVKAGLTWDVAESVPIHEAIKTRSGEYKKLIENYKQTLRNLASCGIPVVAYNFMPVNDWTRTSLDFPMPDGSKALYFNWIDLAVFDIYLLKRPEANKKYQDALVLKAEARFKKMNSKACKQLASVVMFGIPGEHKRSFPEMNKLINAYKSINRDQLRDNLVAFLNEVAPVADENQIRLALHPDDPPFDLFGLPRIVSTKDDYEFIFNAVPSIANGACFCTGSLGAHPSNHLPEMARALGARIHFIHLRNVRKDSEGNFFEDDHLAGDTDMYAVMKELLAHQQSRPYPIPFRPDHGHQMLDDLGKTNNPGYSAIGRLRGLAELRGLEVGICRSEGWA